MYETSSLNQKVCQFNMLITAVCFLFLMAQEQKYLGLIWLNPGSLNITKIIDDN